LKPNRIWGAARAPGLEDRLLAGFSFSEDETMNSAWICARQARVWAAALAFPALLSSPPEALAAGEAACTLKSRSERVAVLVCPSGASQAAMKAAGAEACKERTAGCNAWIWDDATKAPLKAPAIDTDMPKATAGSARAVWLHDSQSLMELRKAR
jgi:hypothetical protein